MNKTIALIAALGLVVSAQAFAADAAPAAAKTPDASITNAAPAAGGAATKEEKTVKIKGTKGHHKAAAKENAAQ